MIQQSPRIDKPKLTPTKVQNKELTRFSSKQGKKIVKGQYNCLKQKIYAKYKKCLISTPYIDLIKEQTISIKFSYRHENKLRSWA